MEPIKQKSNTISLMIIDRILKTLIKLSKKIYMRFLYNKYYITRVYVCILFLAYLFLFSCASPSVGYFATEASEAKNV